MDERYLKTVNLISREDRTPNSPKRRRRSLRAFWWGTLWILGWVSLGSLGAADALGVRPVEGQAADILYDRVLPISGIDRVDGTEAAEPVGQARWRQMYHELTRASSVEPAWPSLETVLRVARTVADDGVIPIVIMNFKYNRIRPGASEDGSLLIRDGRLVEGEGDPYLEARVFAAAAMKDYTHRGRRVVFGLDDALYLANDGRTISQVQVDFDDGRGFRDVVLGSRYRITYGHPGAKMIQLRMDFGDGTSLQGRFSFTVKALETPDPHDTLAVTATIPYEEAYASGEAYIYLSDFHQSLTNPVVVVEGFDIDNTMNWDELYSLLNQEGLVDTLRGRGYDAVVLNFADATDYVQRNAFVIVELIQQINALISPYGDLAVVGASMGGLAGRYALAYMETWGINHNVRTFISFDSPQNGANIPLGVQYWVKFFSGESADAESLLAGLNTPAAKQMLVYHYTDPPGATGESDSLRAGLLSDLAAVGDYPGGLRKVAVANGSGFGLDQGFAPGDQLILYEYNSLLVDIVGNVWAVPDSSYHMIFDGLMDLIWPLPDTEMTVYVEGTRPFDSAPGGWRSSMAQMDSSEATYGDIIALHDNHCFIPTISALALNTEELFYDIPGDPDLLAHTPFDTVYYPAENQEHVLITPENAQWFVAEIERGSAAGVLNPGTSAAPLMRVRAIPNPFMHNTAISFALPREQYAKLEIYDIRGRMINVMLDGVLPAGRHEARWDGTDRRGHRVAPGVYLCRLSTEDITQTARIVLLR